MPVESIAVDEAELEALVQAILAIEHRPLRVLMRSMVLSMQNPRFRTLLRGTVPQAMKDDDEFMEALR